MRWTSLVAPARRIPREEEIINRKFDLGLSVATGVGCPRKKSRDREGSPVHNHGEYQFLKAQVMLGYLWIAASLQGLWHHLSREHPGLGHSHDCPNSLFIDGGAQSCFQ